MEVHIVRQPVLDKSQKLVAYELVYFQDASSLYNKRDARVATTIATFFSELNAESLLGGKECFLTFTPNLLMKNIPHVFDPKKLVIQIEENILVNPEARDIVLQYRDRGYRIAIIGFEFNRTFMNILPDIDIIKVDFSQKFDETVDGVCKLAKSFGKKLAAYGVNSPEARDLALSYDCDYIQGESVSAMVSTRVHKMDHLKSNFFRLVAEISKETPEFDEIAKIISMDVTLSYSLLKLVNSAYFALPNKVKDIKQALTILGMGQLKQWIYLLSFSDDGGVSDELIKTSFLRAVFCQEVAQFIPGIPLTRPEAYLLGMFSTLGVLLEVPIESAIAQIPLSDELKGGLTGAPGLSSDLLNLCISYEKGKWGKVSSLADSLGLPQDIIKEKYLDSVEYVNDIWSELTKSAIN
ncbi:MAG: HDOD domain-containing protein [Clostridiales bacterium]|nr:HDOD domain-containing protein [Clostridiales bacterium]